MAMFAYRAYDASGEMREGEISAATHQAALDILHRQGLVPVSIAERSVGDATSPGLDGLNSCGKRISPSSLLLLTRELASLVAADLTLEDALRIVELQPSLPLPVRQLVAGVLGRVVSGSALSDAFAAEAKDLPPAYCQLLAAAERSGTLSAALTALSDELERGEVLRGELRTALIYPLTLLVAAAATLAVVITILIPALMPLFDEANSKPPVVVAVLDAVRRAVSAQWPWIVLALLAASLLALSAHRNATCREFKDRAVLRMPVIGRLVQRRETGRFAGTLATLLNHGVSPLEAIRAAGNTCSNSRFRQSARDAETHLANGGQLSEALERSGIFTPLALRLTVVGERSGQLDHMLAHLQKLEETALQRELSRLITMLAPALTITIGIAVGGILIAVMSAVVGLNDLAFR